jgi:very-short-patch-repair endonuclease
MEYQLGSILSSCEQKKQENHCQKFPILKLKICKYCETQFQPNSGRQEYCSPECKRKYTYRPVQKRQLTCQHCLLNFTPTGSTSKFCSLDCRTKSYELKKYTINLSKFCLGCEQEIHSNRSNTKYCSIDCRRKHQSLINFSGIEGKDYIVCPDCKTRTRQFTLAHVKMHGYSDLNDFKLRNNLTKVTCDEKWKFQTGDANPAFNHGGKLSAWSKNFIHGYDQERHQIQKENHSKFRNDNPGLFKTNIEYWIKETNGDFDKATELYKLFQIRDLNWFIEKYGKDEGKKRHSQKIERWIHSNKKQNFSKVSQELFHCLIKNLPEEFLDSVYFATYERNEMAGYKNKEYRLKINNSYIMPDFVCLKTRKIIEFDGDYWHSEKIANPQREKTRDMKIIQSGFAVMHVQEHRYKKERMEVIQECLNFLIK